MNVLEILEAVMLAIERFVKAALLVHMSLGWKDEILTPCSHGMRKFPTYFKWFYPFSKFLQGLFVCFSRGISGCGVDSGCGTPV